MGPIYQEYLFCLFLPFENDFDMKNKKKWFAILAILACAAILVMGVLMYTNASLDGKYCLTESNYNHHINSLFFLFLASNLLAITLSLFLIFKK